MDYQVTVFFSEEDGGFIATAPDLPGLSAFGETYAQAIDEFLVAQEGYLAVAREQGMTIPPPRKYELKLVA